MWLPCNFLETIRAREHMGYNLKVVRLIGLGTTPKQGIEYTFADDRDRLICIDKKNDIAFWPTAFNNMDCYDVDSLHDGEIQLTLNIYDIAQYNQYFFDTKSRAEGRLVSICFDRKQQKWRYTFMGADGLAKYFFVPELLIKEPFRAYADDPLLQ